MFDIVAGADAGSEAGDLEVTQLSTRHSATSEKPVRSRAFVVKSDNQSPLHLAPSPDA